VALLSAEPDGRELIDRLPPEFVTRALAPYALTLLQSTQVHNLGVAPGRPADRNSRAKYKQLMGPSILAQQAVDSGEYQPRPSLSAYIEYVAHRYKVANSFPTSLRPTAVDSLLRWYLETYGRVRQGFRIPLSASEINYLNAPVTTVSSARPMSRASLSYYLESDDLRRSLNPGRLDHYRLIAYWWALEMAVALNVEDCLVPGYYLDALQEARPISGSKMSVTTMAEIYFNRREELHSVSLNTPDGALATYLHLALRSVERPDFLRYMPSVAGRMLLTSDSDGKALIDVLVDQVVSRSLAHLPPSAKGRLRTQSARLHLANALSGRGFDVETLAFNTVAPDGHRLDSVRWASVPPDASCDIQVIGPFAKASGLGQACRLAADILDSTRYDINRVNFDLDNPAPEGFSTAAEMGKLKRARVNLIHLNGESVPLAYAYLPDAFTGSYNIGYFYWELDSPANCHYLALNLLDEVWVASEYGVAQYQPHTSIPVSNVGMAFEDVPPIARSEAREFLRSRYGIPSDSFVFIGTFDSFSFIQRKNPIGVVRAFQTAFPDKEQDARLVLKTHNRLSVSDPAQISMWSALAELCAGDDRIQIVDETLRYSDLLKFKRAADAYVSLHRSEGWGFGMLEAMALGVPVICTAYSGNLEFCNDATAWLVDYELVPLRDDEYIFVRPGQRWAEPSVPHAASQMRRCFEHRDRARSKAVVAQAYVKQHFSVPAIAKRFESRVDAILAGEPEAGAGNRAIAR
jgi:glycosyltransferase involved in cell wall biosynthesis